MNFIDIIISILVLISAYKGFKNGLIKELLSLISIFLGIYIAINFSFYMEKFLTTSFPKHQAFVSIISFILVFLIVFLSIKLAGFLMSKLAKSLKLGFLNKLLGLIFGASKVLLIISIILFEINHLSKTFGNILNTNKFNESLLYKPVYNIVPILAPHAKKKLDWSKKLKEKIEQKTKETKDFFIK